MGTCVVCKSNAVINKQDSASRTIYNCQNCGMFVVSDLVEKELMSKSNETASFLMSRKIARKDDIVLISFDKANLDKDYLQMTVGQIAGMFPKSFSEQMDMTLQNLALLSEFAGDEIKVDGLSMSPLFYVRKSNLEALSFIIKAMQKADLISVNYYSGAFFPCGVIISPKGWDRIHELECGESPHNMIFACIPRKENAMSDSIRKAVHKAARSCGLDIVDNFLVTSRPIVGSSLIAGIKSSKVVICDFSEDSGEVYYAAAFAEALGKVCILTCHESLKKKLQIDTTHSGVIFWDEQDMLYLELLNSIKAKM